MNNLFDLTGKVALITGASRGLGQNMARALAKAGADIAITSRTLDSLAGFKEEAEAYGRKVLPLELDVTREESIKAAVEKTAARFGKIDILVNNAGCNRRKYSVDYAWEDWDYIVGTNLKGAFFMAKEVARRMIPRRFGRIINIGSGTSLFGYKTITPYAASRGGIKQMTMCLAAEWAPYNVTVNCLAPGWFVTEQNRRQFDDAAWRDAVLGRIPAGRLGGNNDLDTAVVFFASEFSTYVTGQILCVDGGFTTGDVPVPSNVTPPSVG